MTHSIRARLREFLFPAVSDRWLAVLRIGLGFQVVLYCVSLRSDWNELFIDNGARLIGRDLAEAMIKVESPLVPRFGWLVWLGVRCGLSEEMVLSAAWYVLLLAACCLLVGIFSRSAAVTTWFLQLCSVKSGNLTTYGVDSFATVGLFYLMIASLPDTYALETRWRKVRAQDRDLVGFFQRVLQLHLCAIYFFSGLNKCLGSGWWNGANLWRSLTSPPFNSVPLDVLLKCKDIFPIAGIFVCLLETAYPFFIWPKRTRLVWLVAILGMHIGIGLSMGLYLFSLIMIVLNLAAFGTEFVSIPLGKGKWWMFADRSG